MGETTPDKGSSKQTEAAELLYRAPRRLQRDMETFLALEDEWLPYRLWAVAGKKKLYERALKHGTSAEWAYLLGLQLRSRSQRTAREREARVERELRRLLREHRFESMPSLAILKDVGGSSLAVDVELSGLGPLAGHGGYRFPLARRAWSAPRPAPSKSCGSCSGDAPRGRLAESSS